MKRKENFVMVFISILLILTVSYFAGCGDDSSSTITLPQGATGATGNTGITGNTGPEAGTASLMVNVWQDDAHTQPFTESFTVRLQRIYTNPGTSDVTTHDTSGEGSVTITDVTPGNYRVYVQSVGYPEQAEDVELLEDTATKATVDVDFVLAPEDRVFYAISNPDFTNLDSSSTMTTTGLKQFLMPNKFYMINATTGEATSINTIDNIFITGLAFAPDNTLYAIGFEGYFKPAKERQVTNEWGLYEINPFTGVITPLRPLTGDIVSAGEEDIGVFDLSFAPDGKLYANFFVEEYQKKLETSQSIAVGSIAEISIDTGEVTSLTQPSGYPTFNPYESYSVSIGFSGTNLYFLLGNGYTENPSVYYQWNNYTGASPSLTTIINENYNFFSGMAYYNGNLYSVGSTYTNNPAVLLSIAPATGVATAVGNVRDELDNSVFGIIDMATP